MLIEVMLFGGLEKLIPGAVFGKSIKTDISPGVTVHTLLHTLKLPEEKVSSIIINGIYTNISAELKPGDRVSFFPPIAGG